MVATIAAKRATQAKLNKRTTAMPIKKSDIEHVWGKAKPVRGKNPNQYRRDTKGNVIYKAAYGRNSPMGWQVDHIKPSSKGGSDNRRNLQALQTAANRQKSDKMPAKPKSRSFW